MSHESGTRRLLPRHNSQEGNPEFRPGMKKKGMCVCTGGRGMQTQRIQRDCIGKECLSALCTTLDASVSSKLKRRVGARAHRWIYLGAFVLFF